MPYIKVYRLFLWIIKKIFSFQIKFHRCHFEIAYEILSILKSKEIDNEK